MSFSKMGKEFPFGGHAEAGALHQQYALVIAAALQDEVGDTHRAIKTLVRWTGASERTVKNWLAGTSGPSGEHLIALARSSDEVFDAIVLLTGRSPGSAVSANTVSELRVALQKAVVLAEEISISTE
jgi:hypothetical protein